MKIIQPGVAPKAFGATPGIRPTKFINPERVASIPVCSGQIGDRKSLAHGLQDRDGLKRDLAMMFLLNRDVISHRFNLRETDGVRMRKNGM
jgi:hypothetical protein